MRWTQWPAALNQRQFAATGWRGRRIGGFPTRAPAHARSACEAHRELIDTRVLPGHSAMAATRSRWID
jgi:hypothetical protein